MRTTAMDKRVPRSARLSRRLIVSRNTGPRAPRVHTWLSSCTDARCPSVTPANGHGGVTPQARRGRAAHPHELRPLPLPPSLGKTFNESGSTHRTIHDDRRGAVASSPRPGHIRTGGNGADMLDSALAH